jgi:hypothetical protein
MDTRENGRAGRRVGLMLAAALALAVTVVPSAALADGGSSESTPSDSDLMFEALEQWRGEPPADAAAVERLLAAAKRDSLARRDGGHLSLFWRDPFADDPQALIPVRAEDRALLNVAVENVHTDPGAATSANEDANEDVLAQVRTALAHADEARREAVAARVEARAARREVERARSGCSASGPMAARRDAPPGGDDPTVARGARASRRARVSETGNRQLARTDPPSIGPPDEGTRAADDQRPSKQWVSSDARGILIVPITTDVPRKSSNDSP